MGNVCGSFDGIDHGVHARNDRMLYASQHFNQFRPSERPNQPPAENSSEQKRSSHSSSPQRERFNGRSESNGMLAATASDAAADGAPADDQRRNLAGFSTPGGPAPIDEAQQMEFDYDQPDAETPEPFSWKQVGHQMVNNAALTRTHAARSMARRAATHTCTHLPDPSHA